MEVRMRIIETLIALISMTAALFFFERMINIR